MSRSGLCKVGHRLWLGHGGSKIIYLKQGCLRYKYVTPSNQQNDLLKYLRKTIFSLQGFFDIQVQTSVKTISLSNLKEHIPVN